MLLELSQLAEFPSSWGTSKMAKTLLLSQYLTQGEFMNSHYAHSLKRFLCMPLQLLFPASVEQDSQKEHCLGICPLREFWSPCITSTPGSIGFRASKLITLHIFLCSNHDLWGRVCSVSASRFQHRKREPR